MKRARVLLPLAVVAMVALFHGFARLTPAEAQGAGPTPRELLQLNKDLNDPDKAFEAVKQARAYLARATDSTLRVFLHRGIVTGLIVGKAPGRMVVSAADSALATFPNEPLQRVLIHGQVAQYLVNHHDLPGPALQNARLAVLGLPNDPRVNAFRGYALGTLGEAYLLNSQPDSAVMVLRTAMTIAPDTQRVLIALGGAYRQLKKDDLAIDAYARSLGVFLGADTSAAEPLRMLWVKKYGSLKGYDEKIAKLSEASRRAVALDAREFKREAPEWDLADLDGKRYSLAKHKGKVVVIDFWGTWCGPCREELPIFQRVYEKYKDRVAFYGVNWERAGAGEEVRKNVRSYLEKNSLTFPVVLDHERSAQVAYDVEAFPSMYLIDKTGSIRYRNVGVAPGIEEILVAQIESLLK